MGKTSYKVSFRVVETRLDSEGYAPFDVIITQNSKRVFFSAGKKVPASLWDKVKQTFKGRGEEVNTLNNYLTSLKANIYQKEIELRDRGFEVTPQTLKDAFFNQIEVMTDSTLLEVFKESNEKQAALYKLGRLSKATIYMNDSTFKLLTAFIQERYKRKDIYLKELNLDFMERFHLYLMTDKGMRNNTTTKHLKLLKRICNEAVENNKITANPFAKYKVVRDKVEIEFLTQEEIDRIYATDFGIERLNRMRDVFIFSCYTGLAYSDCKQLCEEHISIDADGRYWIRKKRQKTGNLSRIPMLPIPKAIMEKYKGCKYGGYIVPVVDCSSTNSYLKEIATICRIDKRITFHVARHTFATTVTLANKVSLNVVSKMLGHASIKMTEHYAKVVDESIADEMDKLM
ncbi:MAG: site-specific integrase [Bacteroidales bacterium]